MVQLEIKLMNLFRELRRDFDLPRHAGIAMRVGSNI
jgi:hypothetical protein